MLCSGRDWAADGDPGIFSRQPRGQQGELSGLLWTEKAVWSSRERRPTRTDWMKPSCSQGRTMGKGLASLPWV